ncbi:MAG: AraC family transcriptional regulator [Flavobacteriales bacterium CG03_land_8_20_14_0_80_35_15]|nr:MAG: AraC family transcriptional regulator [Flavobacteriales bacterium CG03_land_8_20_14_0_80_35_15]
MENSAIKPTYIFNDTNKKLVMLIENNTNEIITIKHSIDANFIQFYFCLKGSLKLAFNMPHCAVELKAYNSCFTFFKANQMNLFFDLQPNTTIVAILLKVNHFHELFSDVDADNFPIQNFDANQTILETKTISSEIANCVEQLITNNYHNNFHSLYVRGKVFEILSLYFNETFNKDLEQCPFIANSDEIVKIKKAKELLIKDLLSPPSLESLSKAIGLNVKKLKIGFKDLYGMPAFTYLLHYKMEHARKLLDQNRQNINEIANEVGYSSATHFISAFKSKFGITPKQYTLNKNISNE